MRKNVNGMIRETYRVEYLTEILDLKHTAKIGFEVNRCQKIDAGKSFKQQKCETEKCKKFSQVENVNIQQMNLKPNRNRCR